MEVEEESDTGWWSNEAIFILTFAQDPSLQAGKGDLAKYLSSVGA